MKKGEMNGLWSPKGVQSQAERRTAGDTQRRMGRFERKKNSCSYHRWGGPPEKGSETTVSLGVKNSEYQETPTRNDERQGDSI